MPPASFPFTAGSFDYPHASTSAPSARNLLRSADGSPRRRQLQRPLQRPPTANPSRPQATPSERYLQRAQARIDEERDAIMDAAPEPFDSLGGRPPLMANFHEWIAMANRSPSPRALDTPHRRTKRRKLDHDTSPGAEDETFKYGYKGQMVPGRLRMELVSCDGGQIKRDNPMRIYDVENVLKNDKSVYCSESSTCNLLLRHVGHAPFALEKIVIRAPDRGFTSPYVCLLAPP